MKKNTKKHTPIVAVVGRTNVGKSSLCNALSGKRLSIVEDSPGVTRDRSYALVNRHGFSFMLVDTGGLVGEEDQPFRRSVQEQTELALAEADLILALVDGSEGPQPLDEQVADLLRRSSKPVIWVINKCEKPSTVESAPEFYQLGIGGYVCISAAHNIGMDELVESIKTKLEEQHLLVEKGGEDQAIRIAFIGKPNVGKSTLINKILGVERVIASPIAGTTRDSIEIPLRRDGQDFIIVDTAGLRKKARIEDASVERFSALRSLRALAQADVAVLLIDATEPEPGEQDISLAQLIHNRGIPFLFAVNKWDAVEKDHTSAKSFEKNIRERAPFASYAPVLFISALLGRRCPKVLETAAEMYKAAQERIPTGILNSIFESAFAQNPPPVYRGQALKMYFATQVGVHPPEIVLFMNYPKKVPPHYLRYLQRQLRKEFPFPGSNIKIYVRKRSSKEERLEANAQAAARSTSRDESPPPGK